MSCKRVSGQHTYEVRAAKYLRPAVCGEEYVAVHIGHYPKGSETGQISITVGSLPCTFEPVPNDDGGVDYRLLEGESAISPWMDSDEPQRPDVVVPYFRIELLDWPLRHGPDVDLGQSFREGLKMMLQACMEARDRAFTPLSFPKLFRELAPQGDAEPLDGPHSRNGGRQGTSGTRPRQ